MNSYMIQQILQNTALNPDKPALHTPSGSLSYGELGRKIRTSAAYLSSVRIVPGDRIMVQAGASIAYVVNYLALHYLGAVAIPVDKNASMDTVLLMKNELSVSRFLAESEEFLNLDFSLNSEEISNAVGYSEISPYEPSSGEEISDILFTTGTTGKSKGVVLSHEAVSASVANVKNGTGMKESDVLLIPVPLNHSFGLRELRTILSVGGTAVLMNGFAFAKSLQNNIINHACTCMTCVPAAIRVLYRQAKGRLAEILGSLRYIEFCTAPLDLEMKQILLKQLPSVTLYNSYGSTESAGAVYLNFSANPDKLTSIGIPVNGVSAKIVDDENHTIENSSSEQSGRLAIYGKMNMTGYWNAPDLTAEVLKNGWMFTNDIAYMDDDGYIFLLGRANDVINVGGKKVSPVEVENAAILYPAVQESCCISVEDPDGILGNVPALFVVAETRIQLQEMKDFLALKLESYKLPKEILQIPEIPKNYMGKTDRKALKELYEKKGE